ncbi:MAG: translational GTPase TypA, partial [Planctomycetota bacterium]
TNIRCANAEKGIKLQPPRDFSLEMALEYIEDDELLEITPKTFRLRKKLLTENERRTNKRQAALEPVDTSAGRPA